MDEDVVYGLFALLTKTTLINKCKNSPPEVINHKYFKERCCLSKESNTSRSLHLSNSSKETGKTHQDVVCYSSSSLQTYDYELGATTFYLSLLEWFLKNSKGLMNATMEYLTPPKLGNGFT
jgi:hypothetical protein